MVGIGSALVHEWHESDKATDRLVRSALASLPKGRAGQYLGRNPEALEAFRGRKVKGLGLSERVWHITEQAHNEIATALEQGISEGLSAQELSREVRKHLRDPKALFRRVRDEGGTLRPSIPMTLYRRGSGVYKSAYKNAMRLTRTETNMAYRTAEQTRWQALDFVVGYEVKRSGTGYPCELCDSLKGKYPKSFKWATWHPNCRCYAVPILKTEDELFDDDPTAPSINEVTDLPEGFRAWTKRNHDRLQSASARGSTPYWVRENRYIMQGALTQQQKAKRKEQQQGVRALYAGKRVYNEVDVLITNKGIKELFNQPLAMYNEKNDFLMELGGRLKEAKYLGQTTYQKHNDNIVASHIFETYILGVVHWFIAREDLSGTICLHSITDSDKVLRGIKKKST